MPSRRLAAVRTEPDRALLYARVSMVGGREEIISPEVQVTGGRDRAAADRWTVVREIVELDESGRSFARKGIREAIEGVEAGHWQVIVVYRYDRFGRNAREALVNIARAKKAGGRVVSVTEPFDDSTAIGRYGITNLLAMAELQSDLIGEGWKAAHARRRDRGLPHGGQRRLGYRYVEKRYEPDPDQAPVVAELYRRYVAGDGLRKLADWLNTLGMPTRTATARRWSHNGVRTYLETGFAAGLLHFTDGTYRPGAHPAIIDEATWEAFRAAQERRRGTPQRHLQPTTPYSGVVRCAACQHAMRTHSDRLYGPAYLFQCDNRDCPAPPSVVRSRVEDAVRRWLADYDTEVTTRARARDLTTELRVGARAERRQLEREVARLDKALVKLTKDHATGLVPDGAYAAARDEFLADHAAAEEQLARLGVEATVRPPTRAVVHGLLADWDLLAVPARRDLLAAMVVVWVTRGRPQHAEVDVVPVWERPVPVLR